MAALYGIRSFNFPFGSKCNIRLLQIMAMWWSTKISQPILSTSRGRVWLVVYSCRSLISGGEYSLRVLTACLATSIGTSLSYPLPSTSGFITEREQKADKNQRSGVKQHLLDRRLLSRKLIVIVVACTRPEQDQSSPHSVCGWEGLLSPTLSWGAFDSWWIHGRDGFL